MNARDSISTTALEPARASRTLLIHGTIIVLFLLIPNVMVALQLDAGNVHRNHRPIDANAYAVWLGINAASFLLLLGVRRYLWQPLQRIAHHLHIVREACFDSEDTPVELPANMRLVARDVGRFTTFAIEYYRKHQEVSQELVQARAIIAQFTLQQDAVLNNTGREIGTQYRSVLAYANYLEEQILINKLDPGLRYDFDDVCESSFNLKLIAGALSMLSAPPVVQMGTVPLATLMQQTMLALAPALDRRSMKLTTAEVDMAVAAHGDAQFMAHILWMMLLGMIRYAADESTLRMRCLLNREGTHALLSIVVSELSPLQLSPEERGSHLMRQLQHLTPHMFAETIRIHGNVQLASLLIARMGGEISILPLTVSSCEICMTLPSAIIKNADL